MICALALVSQLFSYIISLKILYLKFYVLLYSCIHILLLCVRLGSGSSQLSYHLRPDLLTTLFLFTLRPISSSKKKAYSRITVSTAVKISHCIILHFISLNIYSPHETCLKHKLYILGGQHEGNHLRDVVVDRKIILK